MAVAIKAAKKVLELSPELKMIQLPEGQKAKLVKGKITIVNVVVKVASNMEQKELKVEQKQVVKIVPTNGLAYIMPISSNKVQSHLSISCLIDVIDGQWVTEQIATKIFSFSEEQIAKEIASRSCHREIAIQHLAMMQIEVLSSIAQSAYNNSSKQGEYAFEDAYNAVMCEVREGNRDA